MGLLRTVTVSDMVVQADSVGGRATVRVTKLAEEEGAAVLLSDVDISGAVVERHLVCYRIWQ